jgi:rSAM/selenodomain-associated transferase 2
MPVLSIIVPALDEGAQLAETLARLTLFRTRGAEVIVADGGSHDDTAKHALPLADRVITAPRGRGAQMNAGAAIASGDILLFLHADTRLPPDADGLVLEEMMRTKAAWGRFDVTIEGRSRLLPLVATLMNLRSRLTGIATGDQAIFVDRQAFLQAGGFSDIPLMEDIALSRRLKRLSPPVCLAARVTTSGRRWDERGAWRTILLMWRLRLAYFLGTAPDKLARQYGYAPRRR